MEKIVELLMKRDGISEIEAMNCLEDCRAEIDDVLSMGGDYDLVEDAVRYHLGLEPDYIFDIVEGI